MEWRLIASISLRNQFHPGTCVSRPQYSAWIASSHRRNSIHRHSHMQSLLSLTGSTSSWSWKTVSAAQSSRHFTINASHHQSSTAAGSHSTLSAATTATATATATKSNPGAGSMSKVTASKRQLYSRDWTLESDALL